MAVRANVGLEPTRIFATGGASANKSILTVMADVFGVQVYAGEQPSSASLGAAYRALHGFKCLERGSFMPFEAAVVGDPAHGSVFPADPAAHSVYTDMLARFSELEGSLLGF